MYYHAFLMPDKYEWFVQVIQYSFKPLPGFGNRFSKINALPVDRSLIINLISKITVQIVSSEWSSLTNPSKNISEFIRFVNSNCNLGKTIISYNTWTFFRLQDRCQHNFNQYHLGSSLMTPRTAEIGIIHRTALSVLLADCVPDI